MSDTINRMQTVELGVARDLVARAQVLQRGAERAALFTGILTAAISLSRRSQSLIERLVRMIDSLEQSEEDPRRLSNLFTMDHLVTRMRRNSENLLLLAGHEGARKWSEPVPLTDVARAAISEIERGAFTSGTRPARILSADGPARFRPRRSARAGRPVSS